MADGRMLKKKISLNEALADLANDSATGSSLPGA